MTDSTKAILTKARSLIESPESWIGGGEEYVFSRACAGVAIDRAARALDLPHGEWRRACDAFRAVIKNPDIIEWNDTDGRTHAEVLSAFDEALAAA